MRVSIDRFDCLIHEKQDLVFTDLNEVMSKRLIKLQTGIRRLTVEQVERMARSAGLRSPDSDTGSARAGGQGHRVINQPCLQLTQIGLLQKVADFFAGQNVVQSAQVLFGQSTEWILVLQGNAHSMDKIIGMQQAYMQTYTQAKWKIELEAAPYEDSKSN